MSLLMVAMILGGCAATQSVRTLAAQNAVFAASYSQSAEEFLIRQDRLLALTDENIAGDIQLASQRDAQALGILKAMELSGSPSDKIALSRHALLTGRSVDEILKLSMPDAHTPDLRAATAPKLDRAVEALGAISKRSNLLEQMMALAAFSGKVQDELDKLREEAEVEAAEAAEEATKAAEKSAEAAKQN